MASQEEQEINEAAYRRLKPFIAESYPHGRFVALYGGAIVGDAASIPELCDLLEAQGRDPQTALAVEAGVDYPEYMTIFGVCEV